MSQERPEPIRKVLEIAKEERGVDPRRFAMSVKRWLALEKLGTRLNLGRPGKLPVTRIGAMLDAIATGHIGLVRLDDGEGRMFTTKNDPNDAKPAKSREEGRSPYQDRRCPDDWK